MILTCVCVCFFFCLQGSLRKEFPQNIGGSDVCFFCRKRVYVMERLSAEGKFFHRSCFKCDYCGTTLRLSSYAFDVEDGTPSRLALSAHVACHGCAVLYKTPLHVCRKHDGSDEVECSAGLQGCATGSLFISETLLLETWLLRGSASNESCHWSCFSAAHVWLEIIVFTVIRLPVIRFPSCSLCSHIHYVAS